jgi:hypothetical protein
LTRPKPPCYYCFYLTLMETQHTTFNHAWRKAEGYSLSTPFGVLSITNDGRRLTFDLYDDVRQSVHNKALFSYYQQLTKQGVSQINVAHLALTGLDKSLKLNRGQTILDMAYIHRGHLVEVELKTRREVGLDRTRLQLQEMVKHCENLVVVVPRRSIEEMHQVLALTGLTGKVKVDSYELYEDETDNGD